MIRKVDPNAAKRRAYFREMLANRESKPLFDNLKKPWLKGNRRGSSKALRLLRPELPACNPGHSGVKPSL